MASDVPAPTKRTVRTRSAGRWRYATSLLLGLSVVFASGVWSVTGSVENTGTIQACLAAVVALAAAGLLPLRPRTAWYSLGLLALLTALFAFWLASPDGSLFSAQILRSTAYASLGGRIFGWTFLLLFPAAWALLGEGVGGWENGLALYLAAGLVFTLVCIAGGLFAPPGAAQAPPMEVYASHVLLWPRYIAGMVGLFGWRYT